MNAQEMKIGDLRDTPVYLQIYRRYREAIASGRLRPGDRVPSVRSLASELTLARGTVELAYQMLANEGYFVARGAAGTIVSPQLGGVTGPVSGLPAPSVHASPHPQAAASEARPFQLGLPALDAFPRKAWMRLAGRCLRTSESVAMSYPDSAGYDRLRRAIANYLGIARGIVCSHEQVFVTAGYRGALELVCRTLLQPGDAGWYEDPGYLFARQFLARAGMRLTPVPVDEHGLDIAIGQQCDAGARFAVVTPTHQSPTGVALSLPRRLELLDWANRQHSWIIEDDYDSEFRYQGRPLPALKSLDRDGRVLYTGTFSKVLFPGLRLAYLVVPAAQVDRFRDAVNHVPGPGSNLLQAMVADFMEQGHFGRHLRKMRLLYGARRSYLVDALNQTMTSRLQVQPQAGGIHVLARLHEGPNDSLLAAAAQSRGLAVQALSDWRMRPGAKGGLLMGFANFTSADQALMSVRQLEGVLASV